MTESSPFPDLQDLADGSPAGPDLGLDATFGEMELAAKGKPEGQFGTTIEPATPPDWKLTATLAEQLLGRTRDLRVMATLSMARLHLAGIPGLASGLVLIRHALENNWPNVHPQLDPEDDNDPMLRANALLTLQNPLNVLRPLRDTPLASPPRGRPVTYRDLAILNGAIEPEPGRERLGEAEIRSTFNKTDPARHQALRGAVSNALADLAGIGAAFDIHAATGSGPDLTPLSKLLTEIGKELARFEPATPEAEPEPERQATAESHAEATSNTPVARSRTPATIRSIPPITNRDDAMHALDLAASYFREHEPSSPVPLLIERARRLAPLPFLEILRDLAPDGLSQAHAVAGTVPE